MDKATVLDLIADARVKGDKEEVRRLQAYLPINPAVGAALVPLYGAECTASLIAQVEASKAAQRAAYEKFVHSPV